MVITLTLGHREVIDDLLQFLFVILGVGAVVVVVGLIVIVLTHRNGPKP